MLFVTIKIKVKKQNRWCRFAVCDAEKHLRPVNFSTTIPYRKQLYIYPHKPAGHEFPHCDYELYRTGEWAFAFASDQFREIGHEISDIPFSESNPPIELETEMASINWNLSAGLDHICEVLPVTGKPTAPAKLRKLIPYGCAKLRMTELPYLKKNLY